MPAASTQNALFVCIETDEPQDDNACSTPLKKLFSNADGYMQHSMRASPSMVPSMVPASHNTNTAGAGASGSTCWAASGSEESSGTHMRRGVGSLRSEVANAVSQLQDALCSDLQDAQLKVFDVLGRGGFGTVYYGAPLSTSFLFRCSLHCFVLPSIRFTTMTKFSCGMDRCRSIGTVLLHIN